MEKVSSHSLPFAISFIISSYVRSVGNIFTACVQGNQSNAITLLNIFLNVNYLKVSNLQCF